ncbi:BTAD domain-containing putative transcriptional regulator [Streptomyces sp. NPDC046859]|uniref:AfsR/SARP family transcriptional regulator n=1 Tax=Streptomyces sp. NPDC046859 TaxID=3155734 RepID=UPI0033E7F48B
MRYRILGPLELWRDGQEVPLAPAKWRMLLAVLLCDANQLVSTDRLIAELWGARPPQSVNKLLQGYVSRVRRALGDESGDLLVTHVHGYRAHGYRLVVTPDEVDSHRFVELVKRGGQELGRNSADAAAALLGEALDLWRDVPFADVPPTPAVEAEASRLTASHTQARELRIEARLRLGRHEAVLDELEALIAEHPLREAMRGQFMLALYRSGRQADALAAYRQLRHRLAEELGIEPGPSLQQLHQRILTADASLLLGPEPGPEPEARAQSRTGSVREPVTTLGPADRAPETDPAPSGRARPDRTRPNHTRQDRAPAGRTEAAAGIPALVPRELPHVGSAFIGRASESSVLRKVLDRADDGHVAIAAIDGTGGVGKSALAIHTAHQLADRFPDGQFYVDLHGATVGLTPLEPGDVLGRFLSTLGLPQVAIPTNPDEAAATFRSMVADRRILVVLDNAAGVEQIRPLLPAGPGCAVLITSREILTALEGATHLHLGVLFHDQAMGLLERLLGPERVAADTEAADAIIRMCGGLPLALRIVGARLAARPSWPLSAFVERLTDAQGRLDEICVGDVSVRASFHASYHAICHGDNPTDQAAARAFRLLGVVPGSSMSLPAAAALLGVSTGPAEDALERLVDAHLLNSPAPARYQMHDLLRLFAREQVWAEEPEAERERALERVLRFYLGATRRAVGFLEVPSYFDRRAQEHVSADMAGTPGLPAARIRDQREAEAWLITERANLIATVLDALTQTDSTARLAVRLTELLQWYLYPYARARELWILGEAAVRTARRLGERESEAWALHNLSAVYWLHRQFDRMRQCLEAALVLWRATGDREGERRSLHNLADALTEMQSYEESVALQTRQLDLAHEAGDRTAQVVGLGDLGRAYRGLGRVEDALACFEESFQHARKIGDSSLQSFALHEISALCFEQGRNQEAHEYLERAGILGGGHLTTYVGWRGHAWSAFFPACLSLRIGPDTVGPPPL